MFEIFDNVLSEELFLSSFYVPMYPIRWEILAEINRHTANTARKSDEPLEEVLTDLWKK